MAKRRRRRREPVWPILLVGAVIVVGGALGVLLTGGERADSPARALESDERAGPADALPPAAWDDRVRVEVLNAAGIRGLAAEGRDRLRDAGFDVVHFGNAATFDRDTSVVLDRTERGRAAGEVAAALGIDRVQAAPDTSVYADVTVLLGTDWDRNREGPPMAKSEPIETDSAESPWWDLRQWWRRP